MPSSIAGDSSTSNSSEDSLHPLAMSTGDQGISPSSTPLLSSSSGSSTLRITCHEPSSVRVTTERSGAVRVTCRDSRRRSSSTNRQQSSNNSNLNSSPSSNSSSNRQQSGNSSSNNPYIVFVVPPASLNSNNRNSNNLNNNNNRTNTPQNNSDNDNNTDENHRKLACLSCLNSDILPFLIRLLYLTCCEFCPLVLGSIFVYYSYAMWGLVTAVAAFILVVSMLGILRWVKLNDNLSGDRCFQKPVTPGRERRTPQGRSVSFFLNNPKSFFF